MDQTALDNGAAADLSRHLQKGSTGRLSVDARGVDVDVYVMNGAVVAAEASDDIKLLLRRLYAAKALTRSRVTELGGQADMGESVFGLILEEVDSPTMETALYERFRDNVSRFLGVRSDARFHPMGAVFVENFQMGHDTDQLLLECAKLWRQSRHVPLSMVLAPKHTEDATEDQRVIAERLDGRRSVRQILHDVPFEPIYGRAVIAGMLANGIAAKVKSDGSPPVGDDPPRYEEAATLAGDPHSISQPSARTASPAGPDPSEDDVADRDMVEPTVLVDTTNYSRDLLPTEQDLIETEVVEQHIPSIDLQHPSDEVWDDYFGSGLEMLEEPSDYRRGLPADTDPEFLDEDSPTVMADYDYSSIRLQRTVEPPKAASATANTYAIPEQAVASDEQPDDTLAPTPSPSAWLSEDVELDDDILEAFADHDHVRGGHEGDGAFSQDTLDRVEVATLPPVAAGDHHEVIEAGAEPTARFGARVLSEEEARNKIDVANDNVGELVRAFDAASGSGRGRAAVQLLLEGCPSKFAPLFHDVIVRPDGTLPVDRVMRNLNVRPETEHRQLLNAGLVDLIERGLSLVMDEVEDDDAIDAVLESTAGYRQRIGL